MNYIQDVSKKWGKVPETEFKEKHGTCIWGPSAGVDNNLTSELTITSSYVHSRVDPDTFTTVYVLGNFIDFIPPVRDFGFGL